MKSPEQQRIDKLEEALQAVYEENQKLQVIYRAARLAVLSKKFAPFRRNMNRLAQKIRHYEDSKR